ncbi:MAG: response regulator [Elusimicrobia bacterium]|nr:response regulator [Elusimicrobiota bacterium]
MKVLIVDDNDIMRDVLRTFLEQLKHEVLGEEENGDAAIRSFAALRPDLVLLDMVMPGRSGLEALDEIRKLDPAAKVVVITAVEQEGLDRKIYEKGAAAILRKPFSCEELEKALAGLV